MDDDLRISGTSEQDREGVVSAILETTKSHAKNLESLHEDHARHYASIQQKSHDTFYQNYMVGDEVVLKSILNSTETVAKGWLRSLNPTDIVGGTEIGRGWCEVNVQVATKRDEILVRPYGLFTTIEDCVGATIAWPCPFISAAPKD